MSLTNDSGELLTTVLAVSRTDEHGVPRILAHPMYIGDEGLMRPPIFTMWDNPVAHLADLELIAYIEREEFHDSDRPKTYGYGAAYRPHTLELEQAEAAVKTLRKIRTGLDRANEKYGWVPPNAFHTYVLRVAKILKIDEIRVRNSIRAERASGETWRSVNGSDLEAWMSFATTDDYSRR